ncbi:hypothetical protein O181_128628 [Austropuccinia psidii MF-1]|uniref:Uncharacterized protein n=1 Tax=Austropuccinia psidii MF-1 TaxID=1389203 RepID=A0A9Q3KVB7_9BASI|nr:hypothetical protein [Austropuccinia psidii MF-1]
MNFSSLQIQQDVLVAKASKVTLSIIISSTPDPRNTEASNGKSSYLRDLLFNSLVQYQSNAQISSETTFLKKQSILNIDMVSGAHEKEIQKHRTSEKRNISKVGKDGRIIPGMSSFDK